MRSLPEAMPLPNRGVLSAEPCIRMHGQQNLKFYHSALTHLIGVCDPVYETVIIHVWGYDDIGVLQESPHFVGVSKLVEAYALKFALSEFTSDTVQISILRKFKLI